MCDEGLENIRPPLFLTAISARTFSKPMSRSCSRSVAMLLLNLTLKMSVFGGNCLDGVGSE